MYASRLPPVSAATLTSLLPFGPAILELFSENPRLLDRPYTLKTTNEGGYRYAVDTAAYQNPVIAGLHAKSVDFNAVLPEAVFRIWEGVLFPDPLNLNNDKEVWKAINIRSFAIVDLSIYYVKIANIYTPNKALIRNLYATQVETDSIGRVNEDHALKLVQKIVSRYDVNPLDLTRVAEHVIILLKYDAASTAMLPEQRGIAFERECAQLLSKAGFDVRETPTSGDFGADLIASKDGLGFAIQCKNTSKPVGVKAVQEAVSAKSHYKVDYAVVCSTARFTDAAVELGTSNNVIMSNARNLASRLEAL